MENLIDLGHSQSELQHPISSKIFGIIKRYCVAHDVTNIHDENGECLKPGTLIQIIPGYRVGSCYFKIRDFANWSDKYRTTIYKCSIDDYIAVGVELWPFLLAIDNGDARVKYVQNVYNMEFNMDLLKLGREIRIQAPPDANVEFIEFLVSFVGVVDEIGMGQYIGLRLKNENMLLTPSLKGMAQYYKFGGTGIIVPPDWIMFNLYQKGKCKSNSFNTQDRGANFLSGNDIAGINHELTESDSLARVIELPKENNKTGAVPKTKIFNRTNQITNYEISRNLTEKVKEGNEIACGNSNTKPLNYTNEIELFDNADGVVKNVERTKCDLCFKEVEVGDGIILRDCIHTFCVPCARAHVECNTTVSGIQCPYNNEYKCQSNLLDIEIKDLGGDAIYSKILENRLKEFLVNDPNARMCSNNSCKNIWVSPGMLKNERCPKCRMNWCYECGSVHEPGTRHQNKSEKSITEKWLGWVFGSEPSNSYAMCAKCRKPEISITQRLKNCGHIFCNDCINAMISSELQFPECPICRRRLDGDEVAQAKTKMNARKLFNTADNSKPEIAIAAEICLCNPPNSSACRFLLKCKHEFCRTLLTGIIRMQLIYTVQAACPVCFHKIADYQLTSLFDQKKSTADHHCQICNEQPVVQLTRCNDWFCRKCIYDMMKKQATNPKKTSIICTVCNSSITRSDIERYGSSELLAHFELNIIKNRVIDSTLNNWPVCSSCEQRTSTQQGIILDKCRDFYCISCCRSFISKQVSNKQIPSCPFCKQTLEKVEIEWVMQKRFDKFIVNTSLVKCLKCSENFEDHLIYKCSECLKTICNKCADVNFENKLANNDKPICPFCAISLNKEQSSSAVQLVQNSRLVANVNNNAACSICLNEFNGNKIELIDCSH